MTEHVLPAAPLSDLEYLRILRLVEQIRTRFDERVDVGQSDPDWRMITYLIRGYISGEPVTISSLIQVSGITYGTAQRRVHALLDLGLIEKKARSKTNKSFYLQPSARLLADFTDYVAEMKLLLARTVGVRSNADADDFYFGGADYDREFSAPESIRLKLGSSGRSLKFLLNDDNYFAAMRNMWSDYRNNLGSRKSFTLKMLPELHSELKVALGAAHSEYDVVALNMPWLGEFANEGRLRCLDDYITDDNIRPMDYHPAVWSNGQWNGRQYGIPIYITVEVMAVRRDLFEDQRLDPPRTFDQVIEVGRRFHNPARDFYGIAWNGARGMPIASTFMILMGCCGAPILNLASARRYHDWAMLCGEQLRPRIDCEEARGVLDYLKRLIEISPPDILQMDWERRISSFLNGEVAMTYCWTMRASRFESDIRSMVKRRTRLIPQPKSSFGASNNPIGGFLLAIPSSVPEERAQLAFQAISWMASPEAMKKHVTNGLPVAPRFSVAADPEVASTSPIVRFVDTLAQRNLLCTWQRPPVPEYRQIEFVLGNRIHSALSGELTVDEALALSQREIDQVMRRAGRY